jgi:hypothetical protein
VLHCKTVIDCVSLRMLLVTSCVAYDLYIRLNVWGCNELFDVSTFGNKEGCRVLIVSVVYSFSNPAFLDLLINIKNARV